MRVFGALLGTADGVNDVVKIDSDNTPVNSLALHDLQHKIALLEIENDSLKGAVKARDEHIDSLRQAMQLIEHKKESLSQTKSIWWKFWGKK